jgi:hypothetical protein
LFNKAASQTLFRKLFASTLFRNGVPVDTANGKEIQIVKEQQPA